MTGRAPLFTWIVSAGISIVIMLVLTKRALLVSLDPSQRESLFVMFLQLVIIVAGNATITTMLIIKGVRLEAGDYWIVGAASLALAVMGSLALVGKLRLTSNWAKCWYTISLKAWPQICQAVPLAFGGGGLHPIAVGALFLQGSTRFYPALQAWHKETPVGGRQTHTTVMVSTGADLASIIILIICQCIGWSGGL